MLYLACTLSGRSGSYAKSDIIIQFFLTLSWGSCREPGWRSEAVTVSVGVYPELVKAGSSTIGRFVCAWPSTQETRSGNWTKHTRLQQRVMTMGVDQLIVLNPKNRIPLQTHTERAGFRKGDSEMKKPYMVQTTVPQNFPVATWRWKHEPLESRTRSISWLFVR